MPGVLLCRTQYFVLVLVFLLSSRVIVDGEELCSSSERDALLELQKALHGVNLSWVGSNCCSWREVECDFNRVISLSLPSLSLTGAIPVNLLSTLPFLRSLNLSHNGLFGSIPSDLSLLSSLQILDLSSNNFSGNVSIVASLPAVQFINISSNDFTGSLPILNQSMEFQEFYAQHNRLSGELIPESLCKYAPNLRKVSLSYNELSGSIGYGFSLCKRIGVLLLGFNKIKGALPPDLYNTSSLSTICFDNNSFTGNISEDWGSLRNLKYLTLSHNYLEGQLPRALSSNSELVVLDLSSNWLSGTMDGLDFSNLTHLEILDLNTNYLSGAIPASLGLCASLWSLNLAHNKLSGQIPSSFNSLQNLTSISLSTNNIHGGLLSLENCQSLVTVVLSKNYFTELLPFASDGFHNLQVLALGFLNLQGDFPHWLENCTKLQILDLSWNHLQGELPSWIGNFAHLTFLDISNNSFTGMLPTALFSLPSLMHADTNTTELQTITNVLSVWKSGFPELEYRQSVSLPPSMLLSSNQLTGDIPDEIGQLRRLLVLDLSHNQLTGAIPASIANITMLERLDLSDNLLRGSIPSSLVELTFLSSFNVSYNRLSGKIPHQNQFLTFPSSSYEGNTGLCGTPILVACSVIRPANMTYSVGMSKKGAILFVAIGMAFALFFILICRYVLWRRVCLNAGKSKEVQEIPSKVQCTAVHLLCSQHKLSVEDLCKATNKFDEKNIIGCGGFGLVYRADLDDGSRLAIKKLSGDGGQMEKEFWAEVDALSKAQHRNLVSLQGYAQMGNERLLIYSYMENGSLDYWLHEQNTDGAQCLDWARRLKIAKGAAQGLAYLHEGCTPHIVHRDIKSSNILLNDKFEAHVADFGLARLMMATQTHVTTELVGTLGYIPPEYSSNLNATMRGDVYSFGVVLLELLTGKRPVDVCRPKECADLVSWVLSMGSTDEAHLLFDHRLFLQVKESQGEQQLYQVLDIASCCVSKDPLKRPSMKVVSFLLSQIK